MHARPGFLSSKAAWMALAYPDSQQKLAAPIGSHHSTTYPGHCCSEEEEPVGALPYTLQQTNPYLSPNLHAVHGGGMDAKRSASWAVKADDQAYAVKCPVRCWLLPVRLLKQQS
jgi:hypothetical protein